MYTAADGFMLAGGLMLVPGAVATLAWPFTRRRRLLSGPVADPAVKALYTAGAVSCAAGCLLTHQAGWAYAFLALAAIGLGALASLAIMARTG
jgi:hypothetical protein